jgi:hypothetical protein
METLPAHFSEVDCAALLGVRVSTLRRWRAHRQGPPFTVVSRKFYYRRAAVENWLLARERNFDEPPRRRAARG